MERKQRTLTPESTYAGGMNFTDTPLNMGSLKILSNFNLKNKGMTLVPRPGMRSLQDVIQLLNSTNKVYLHHVGRLQITDDAGVDTIKRYVLIGPEPVSDTMLFTECTMLVEDVLESGEVVLSIALLDTTTDGTYKLRTQPTLNNLNMHGMSYNTGNPEALHSILNNALYMPVQYATTGAPTVFNNRWAKITLSWNETTAQYTAAIDLVAPKVMTPSEALNYGYNMLDETPYAFDDVISAGIGAGFILLEGVLPYKDAECTELCFNAHVGEPVYFRLYGQYPDATSLYKFRWELHDLETDAVTVVADQGSSNAPTYNYDATEEHAVDSAGNDFVSLRVVAPYKRFSVVVTAYASTDLTEPLQVIVLSSYTLAAEGESTNNIEVRSYDMSTAKTVCVWNHRTVLANVDSAPNLMFVSDINDMTYFPYPNNAEIFEEKVLHCEPYMSDLLVFTEKRLYLCKWAADGLSYTKEIVQDNLSLSEAEARTITVVKNMVFFKNYNYYYMIVPSATSEKLLIAPISQSITDLLDDFEKEVLAQIVTMYNPVRLVDQEATTEFTIQLNDYYVFLDNAVVKNVYKFTLKYGNETVLYFDYILNYDTLLRVWTTSVFESNPGRILPYRKSVTTDALYTQVYSVEDPENPGQYLSYMELIENSTLLHSDNFHLTLGDTDAGRRFKNWQYFDTGYKDMDTKIKKRFRQIQLKVNNDSTHPLLFGTEFLVDDSHRKELTRYEAIHNVDEDDPNFGQVLLEPVFIADHVAPGPTVLDAESAEIPVPEVVLSSGAVLATTAWALDFSKLGTASTATITFPVSGKGYCPRLKLLSFNEEPFELLQHIFIARTMNWR